MFDDKDVCWLWTNPNPHSKKVHRVSIWGAKGLASCVSGLYLYAEALAGKVRKGNARQLSCKICIDRTNKKPLLSMQLLAAFGGSKHRGLIDFRRTLMHCEDSPDIVRQTGIVAADWLEEQGDSLCRLVRLICCESSDWELIGEVRPILVKQLEQRLERQQQQREAISLRNLTTAVPERQPSWLVWK